MTSTADSGAIATEKNPKELAFTKLVLSPVVSDSPHIRELPLFPPISRGETSETPEAKDKIEEEGINTTWRKQKGCRCKQSKCLKLYCNCFASGVLCKDCDCADCHNNPENSDVREAAMVKVLDRNPNAFNGNPPSYLIDKRYKAATDSKLGLLSRGCKCKRTKCLKKYCECFQANVLCSDNCKCIDCGNVSGGVQPSVFPWSLNSRNLLENNEKPENIDNVNALGIISTNRHNVGFNSHETADCMIYAPECSAQSSVQVYRRKRYREPPEWDSCPAPFGSMPDYSILNSLDSPMYTSPKLPYRKKRSRLGYTKRIPDLGDISSLLLAASESATPNAVNVPVLELQSGLQDQNRICIRPNDKEDKVGIELSNESEIGIVEEYIQSCGKLIELIDCQYNGEVDPQCKETKTSCARGTDIYMEQERAVLETFRDCLHKYMKIGFKKGRFHSRFNKQRAEP